MLNTRGLALSGRRFGILCEVSPALPSPLVLQEEENYFSFSFDTFRVNIYTVVVKHALWAQILT